MTDVAVLDSTSTRGPASKCGMTDVAVYVDVLVDVLVAGFGRRNVAVLDSASTRGMTWQCTWMC